MSPVEFQFSSRLETAPFLKALSDLKARKDLGYMKRPELVADWNSVTAKVRELMQHYTRLVVLGLGGSNLGGAALIDSVSGPNHNVEFWGEIDPVFLDAKLKSPLIDDTLFLVISKSGKTLEVATLVNAISQALLSRERSLADQCYVITEMRDDNPLRKWALDAEISIIDHPLDVGGRYSVFTPVGLFPAVFAGVDIEKVRQGAAWVLTQEDLIAGVAAYFHYTFAQQKTISVFWSYISPLGTFQKWLEQLWAESLGQALDRKSMAAPTVSTPLMVQGVSSQHSVLQQFSDGANDKSFLFFRLQDESLNEIGMRESLIPSFEYLAEKTVAQVFSAEADATQEGLEQKHKICARLEINRLDAFTVGAIMMLFQAVVGTLGEALNIDAYVQPGVELGKKLAIGKLKGSL